MCTRTRTHTHLCARQHNHHSLIFRAALHIKSQFAAGSGASYVFGATLQDQSAAESITNYDVYNALFNIDPLPDVLSLSACSCCVV